MGGWRRDGIATEVTARPQAGLSVTVGGASGRGTHCRFRVEAHQDPRHGTGEQAGPPGGAWLRVPLAVSDLDVFNAL